MAQHEFRIVAELGFQLSQSAVRDLESQLKGGLRNLGAEVDVRISPTARAALGGLARDLDATKAGMRATSDEARRTGESVDRTSVSFSRLKSAADAASAGASGLRVSLKGVSDESGHAGARVEDFGERTRRAAERFAAFTLGAGGLIAALRGIRGAVSEAIAFDREMVRLAQVSGTTLEGVKGVRQEIFRLAGDLGVSSKELAQAAVQFRHLGLSADDTELALQAVAKASLSPTFGDMEQTGRAAIAMMAQFKLQAGQLEDALGAVNSVSSRFAVESKDILQAVEITGNAFKNAGGNLNELVALFSAVRSTTRESAGQIASGIRTILMRTERPTTLQHLSDLGVELRRTREEALRLGDAGLEGQFVGPYEAVKRLSGALSGLRGTDPRFLSIANELGGYRQVSRVIPLLQEQAKMQEILNVAQLGGVTVSQSAAQAQSALAVQMQRVHEKFNALVDSVVQSPGFKAFILDVLKLTEGLVSLVNVLRPLLPMLATLAAVGTLRAVANVAPAVGGFLGVRKAAGDVVPGQGNMDSVPAMLTPGEFVVRKASAQKIGYDRLRYANERGELPHFNRGGMLDCYGYAAGGSVSGTVRELPGILAGAGVSEPNVEKFLRELSGAVEGTTKVLVRLADAAGTTTQKMVEGYSVLAAAKPALDPKNFGDVYKARLDPEVLKSLILENEKTRSNPEGIFRVTRQDRGVNREESLRRLLEGQPPVSAKADRSDTVARERSLAELARRYGVPRADLDIPTEGFDARRRSDRERLQPGTLAFLGRVGGEDEAEAPAKKSLYTASGRSRPSAPAPAGEVFGPFPRIPLTVAQQSIVGGSFGTAGQGYHFGPALGYTPETYRFPNPEVTGRARLPRSRPIGPVPDTYDFAEEHPSRVRNTYDVVPGIHSQTPDTYPFAVDGDAHRFSRGRVVKGRFGDVPDSLFARPPSPARSPDTYNFAAGHEPTVAPVEGYRVPSLIREELAEAKIAALNSKRGFFDPIPGVGEGAQSRFGSLREAITGGNGFRGALGNTGRGIAALGRGAYAAAANPYVVAGGSAAALFGSELVRESGGEIRAGNTEAANERSRRASGTSGLLQGAAVGALGGTVAGPIGVAAGAVAGGLFGMVTSLRRADEEIREVKLADSLSKLKDVMDATLAKEGPLSASDAAHSVTAVRDLQAQTLGKSRAQATNIFGGFDVTEFGAASKRETKQNFGQLAPQFAQFLTRSASDLGKTANLEDLNPGQRKAALDKLTQTFAEGNNGLNREYLRVIAQLKGVSIADAARDFTKAIEESARAAKLEREGKKVSGDVDRSLSAFGRLASAAEAAATSLASLQARGQLLAALFEGRVAPAHVAGVSGVLAQPGTPDRGAFLGALGTVARPFGAQGSSLFRTGAAVGDVSRALPTILSKTLASAPLGHDDYVSQVRRQLVEQLGGAGAKYENLSPEHRQAVDSVTHKLGTTKLEDIAGKTGSDVTKFSKSLLSDFEPVKEVWVKIAKELDAHANAFIDGLAQNQHRLQQINQERDRLGQIQLGGQRASAQFFGQRLGFEHGGTDLLSLSQLNAPLQAQQERLTGLRGAAANSPQVIAQRLQATQAAVKEAQVAQEQAFRNNPADTGAAERLSQLQGEAANLQQALKNLTETTNRNAAAQEKLNRIQSDREGRLGFAESYINSDPREQAKTNRQLFAATSAFQRGSLGGLSHVDQQDVLAGLNKLGDAQLPAFGGLSGTEAKKQLIKNTFGGDVLEKGKQAEEQNLQQSVLQNFQTAADAQAALIESQKALQGELFAGLKETHAEFFKNLERYMQDERKTRLEVEKGQKAAEVNELQKKSQAAGVLAGGGFDTQAKINALNNPEARKAVEGFAAGTDDAAKNAKLFGLAGNLGGVVSGAFGGGDVSKFNPVRNSLGDAQLKSIGEQLEVRSGGQLSQPEVQSIIGKFQAITKASAGNPVDAAIGDKVAQAFGGNYATTNLDANLQEAVRQHVNERASQNGNGQFQNQQTLKKFGIDPTLLSRGVQAAGGSQQFFGNLQSLQGTDVGSLPQALQQRQGELAGVNAALTRAQVPVAQDATPAQRQVSQAPQESLQRFNAEASQSLQAAVAQISSVLQPLTNGLSQLNGLQMTIEGKQTVEVVINGAEALANLTPAIQEMIAKQTEEKIQYVFRKHLPDAGSVSFDA